MQFIKRWIYWHNFELGFIVNIDLWIVFCDKLWSADLMAHTPTHEWQVSLQSTYTWILYTLWTLLSYVKINIEYPVNPSCFQVLPPSLYTKLSTSSRRTLVVTTARIRPHFCVIHINIILLHKLTHCVRDNSCPNGCYVVLSHLQCRLEISKLKAKMYQHMWFTSAFYANAYVWLITYTVQSPADQNPLTSSGAVWRAVKGTWPNQCFDTCGD